MKIGAKFVLNRNDQEYYYVEKSHRGEKYHVHLTKDNILLCNDHNFHAIYGNDEKMSLQDFIERAIIDLISGYHSNEDCYESTEKFKKVLARISNIKNKKNPDLGNSKAILLEAIDIYNDLGLNIELVEVPYEENYKTIMEAKPNTKDEEIHQSTTYISSITRLNSEYKSLHKEHHKEIVRTKKYDKVA